MHVRAGSKPATHPPGFRLGPSHPQDSSNTNLVAELRGLAVKAQEQLLEPAAAAPEAAGLALPFPGSDDGGADAAAAAAASGTAAPSAGGALASFRRGAGEPPPAPPGGAAAALARAQQVAISILEPCDIVATVRMAEAPTPLQDIGLDISDVQLRMSPDVLALVTNHLAVGGRAGSRAES
jgi:hypothetical protein